MRRTVARHYAMKSVFGPTLVAAVLTVICMTANPAPLFGADELQRNGAVSRHVWTPNFATAEMGGLRVSAGIALGLKGAIQSNLGRNVTPALTLELGSRSSVSLLPAGGRGAMLVVQTTH